MPPWFAFTCNSLGVGSDRSSLFDCCVCVLVDLFLVISISFFIDEEMLTDVCNIFYCSFDETMDEVIYPKGDPDAVSISMRDVELLQPETFINDTIIDFYIK